MKLNNIRIKFKTKVKYKILKRKKLDRVIPPPNDLRI